MGQWRFFSALEIEKKRVLIEGEECHHLKND
jgi:hypothetical protein